MAVSAQVLFLTVSFWIVHSNGNLECVGNGCDADPEDGVGSLDCIPSVRPFPRANSICGIDTNSTLESNSTVICSCLGDSRTFPRGDAKWVRKVDGALKWRGDSPVCVDRLTVQLSIGLSGMAEGDGIKFVNAKDAGSVNSPIYKPMTLKIEAVFPVTITMIQLHLFWYIDVHHIEVEGQRMPFDLEWDTESSFAVLKFEFPSNRTPVNKFQVVISPRYGWFESTRFSVRLFGEVENGMQAELLSIIEELWICRDSEENCYSEEEFNTKYKEKQIDTKKLILAIKLKKRATIEKVFVQLLPSFDVKLKTDAALIKTVELYNTVRPWERESFITFAFTKPMRIETSMYMTFEANSESDLWPLLGVRVLGYNDIETPGQCLDETGQLFFDNIGYIVLVVSSLLGNLVLAVCCVVLFVKNRTRAPGNRNDSGEVFGESASRETDATRISNVYELH